MAHDKDSADSIWKANYSRRGFIQFVGVGAGVVGASLVGAPFSRPQPAQAGQEVLTALERVKVRLNINGRNQDVLVEPRWSLLYVLREVVGLAGTKIGCDRGECGACTVLIDDQPRYACLTLAIEAEESRIVTVEGLMDGEGLGPVQTAFLEADAFQCGYCTPGQIMAVEGLLRKHRNLPLKSGRVFRHCTLSNHTNIFKAAQKAAELKKGSGGA
jgi:xanthine dehydrogenase YagT iron-sulfur-binding subunit